MSSVRIARTSFFKISPLVPSLTSTSTSTSRLLTTSTSNAVNKLRSAVEDYRVKNYSGELPSRCKKEIVHAADFHKNGQITTEGLLTIVHNIGAGNQIVKEDIEGIMRELGDTGEQQNTTIAVDKILRII
eukprot:CAMPEP_0197236798 /NCGR_PEP_ID=MMETSP1429-20130617/3803_1 /TAXON_ID=49237 /ORGANISM="Chaetoceros  sp., Strain UNC1202" /LENGTH=129 /DNA_ID=CAMNT_0042695671 /DNA_START=40 /DNA_END=429 /DNA_ORIENTATION=-